MNCIIDVGGGNKGVFGAGVLDRCLHEGILVDNCIGISAGSANIITYAARQDGRLYRFYRDYSFRKDYMSLQNVVKKGRFIDLDYIFSTLCNSDGEDPLDLQTAQQYPGNVEITVTDAVSGKARYVRLDEIRQDDYWCLKASCAIPFVCKPIANGGHVYFDGGLADPIPINRAVELGCDKIVLVLSRPRDYRRSPGMDAKSAPLIRKQYPLIANLLEKRAETYNALLEQAIEMEKEGKVLIISPPVIEGVTTLKKTPEGLEEMFRCAYQEGAKIKDFLAPAPAAQ